jgi:hypothetical protein
LTVSNYSGLGAPQSATTTITIHVYQ